MQPNKPVLYSSSFQRQVDNECKMSVNRGIYDKKINWYVLLDWSGQSRTFVKFIFHAWFFTCALSEEQRAYIVLFKDEKDVSVKQISRKTGISPTTIRSTNNM